MNRLVMVDVMETSTTFCLNMTVGKDVEVNANIAVRVRLV